MGRKPNKWPPKRKGVRNEASDLNEHHLTVEVPRDVSFTLRANSRDVERFKAMCKDPDTLMKRTHGDMLFLLIEHWEETKGT